MPSTILYLGEPGTGKSYLMRDHVERMAEDPELVFLIVDHDDSWAEQFPETPIFDSPAAWWANPARVAIFRGVPGGQVAQLAIDIGWAVYVDDECDAAISESWKTNPIREIVKRGRHLRNRAGQVTGVTAMLATHRPANLPTDVIGLFERVYIGRLRSFNDAERVYREGWIREAKSAIDCRQRLEAHAVGEFTVWP